MTKGVVRNGLWYPDDRDWVEVVDGKTPEQIIGCGAQEWTYLSFSERESRSFDGDGAIYVKPGEFLFGSEDVVAVLDLRPKPQQRKDNGPSADTQARDWCHQQWTETERELRKANAYIRELEAERDLLKEELEKYRSAALVDRRPDRCRFRLQDEGKPYPRSGCEACNRTIGTGLGRKCHLESSPL